MDINATLINQVQAFLGEQERQRQAIVAVVARGEADVSRLRVENAASSDAELWLFGDIGFDWTTGMGISAKDVADALQYITAKNLTVHLDSGGGSLFEGLAMFAVIRNHPATVTMLIEGTAASAASVVAMAGDRILLSRGSSIMIHEPSGLTMGPAAAHHKSGAFLDQIADNIAGIYADRGGRRVNWRAKMREELWLFGQAAVDAGLADEVLNKPAVQNTIDFSVYGYANVPAALVKAQTPDDLARAAVGAPVQHITINNNYGASIADAPIIDVTGEPDPDDEDSAANSQEASEPTEEVHGLSVISAKLLIDLAEAEVLAIR